VLEMFLISTKKESKNQYNKFHCKYPISQSETTVKMSNYGNYDHAHIYTAATPTTTYDTTYDSGYGTTSYDPQTGAYDQHLDYETPTGRRHHRERVDPSGTYRHRDVDRYDDGTSRVHREYDNPNTGTSYHRDYER
jgi:hypothetical protein